MSTLKKERKITSKDINQEEQKIQQLIQYYQTTSAYEFVTIVVVNDIEEIFEYFIELVMQGSTESALEIGEKLYFTCIKFLMVNSLDSLNIDVLDPIVVFIYLFYGLCYTKGDRGVAENIFEHSKYLAKHLNQLYANETVANEKSIASLATMYKIAVQYSKFCIQRHLHRQHEFAQELQESYLQFVATNQSYTVLRQGINDIVHASSELNLTWVKDYFARISPVIISDLLQQTTNKFSHYATLAELYLDIFNFDVAFSYALLALKQNDKSQPAKPVQQKLIVESVLTIRKSIGIPATEDIAVRLRKLRKYLTSIDAEIAQGVQRVDSVYAKHLALCCQVETSAFTLEEQEVQRYCSDIHESLQAAQQIAATNKGKFYAMQFRQLRAALKLVRRTVRTASVEHILNDLINQCLPDIIESDIKEQYVKSLNIAQVLLELALAIVDNEAISIDEKKRWLKVIEKKSTEYENKVLAIVKIEVVERNSNFIIDENEIYMFVDIHQLLIKFFQENNFIEELVLQFRFLESYITLIYTLLTNKRSNIRLKWSNLIDYIDLCDRLADNHLLKDDEGEFLARKILGYAQFTIATLARLQDISRLSAEHLGWILNIYYKLFKLAYLNGSLSEAIIFLEESLEYERYYSLSIIKKYPATNGESSYLAVVIHLHYLAIQYYEKFSDTEQRSKHYEALAGYLVLWNQLNLPESAKRDELALKGAPLKGWPVILQEVTECLQKYLMADHQSLLSRIFLSILSKTPAQDYDGELPLQPLAVQDSVESTLTKLFLEIENRTLKVKECLALSDAIIHEKHPMLGVNALCHAAFHGNIIVFMHLIKRYQFDSSEQCNVLSWICLCLDKKARTTVFEILLKNLDKFPSLNQSYIEAARGNLEYFSATQHVAETCFYYAKLARQQQWLDIYQTTNEIAIISAPGNIDQTTSQFIKHFRLFCQGIENGEEELANRLIDYISNMASDLVALYLSKKQELPIFLQKYILDTYYYCGIYYLFSDENNNAIICFNLFLTELEKFMKRLFVADYPLLWLFDIYEHLHGITLFFAKHRSFCNVFHVFQLGSQYFTWVVERFHISPVPSERFTYAIEKFLGQLKILFKQYAFFVNPLIVNRAYKLLSSALQLCKVTEEPVISELGYKIIFAWYQKIRFHIYYDKGEATIKLPQIRQAIADTDKIESALLKLLASREFNKGPIYSWYYKMLFEHAATHKYLIGKDSQAATSELIKMIRYLKLISKLINQAPLDQANHFEFENIVRICLPHMVLNAYTGDLLFTLINLENICSNSKTSGIKKSHDSTAQTTIEINRLVRLFARVFCQIRGLKDDDFKQNILNECANAISTFILLADENIKLFSVEELQIICECFLWYLKHAGEVTGVQHVFSQAEIIIREFSEKISKNDYNESHYLTLVKIHTKAFKLSVKLKNEPVIALNHAQAVMELITTIIKSSEKLNLGLLHDFIVLTNECIKLFGDNKLVKEESEDYKNVYAIINEAEIKFGISSL